MVDTTEYGISRGRDCGNPISIVLVCWLLSATSTVDLYSSSFSPTSVSDVVEGLSLTTCVVPTSCSDTLWVSRPCPPVDWLLEDKQLVKRWSSWKVGVVLAAIFRNFACCTDNSHCCFIGVGYWWNLTRESSKSLRSRGRYNVWLNYNL